MYLCHLYDAMDRQVGMCIGYGAHLDPEIAMLRAITEAVQARAVIIAGSRDDIFRRNIHQIRLADTHAHLEAALHSPATVDAGNLVSEATETFEGDIAVLLAKVRHAGLRRVILFDLSRREFPFAVVRIVVPGLEGYKFDYYTPGRRALALLRRREEEVCR